MYTPADYDTYLMALMGVFADSSGRIVGNPFEIGTQTLALAVPPGATLLQLGINDDIFGDNDGSLTVDVTVRGSGIPDGGSCLLLLGTALLGLRFLRARSSRC